MQAFAEAIRVVNLVAFALLAIVAILQWRRRRDEATQWLALTFGVLAGVAISGAVMPSRSDEVVIDILRRIDIAILILLPYFLYRFSASFEKPTLWLDRLALGLTGIGQIWGVLLPEIPDPGEPREMPFEIFVIAALVQWVFLSVVVATRLWRSGRGLPDVAKHRMRLLAAGAAALSVGIVVSASAPADRPAVIDIVAQLFALASAVTFFLGFSPPRVLRLLWRRNSQDAMRRAVTNLLSSNNDQEVAHGFLPHMADIVGGSGVAILAPDDRVIDSYGIAPDEARNLAASAVDPEQPTGGGSGALRLRFPFGCILVASSPYTPYFGEEEIQLLQSMGVLMHLALERTRTQALQLQLTEARLRREQALEINDNVVQGLAVAKYAFELGDERRGREALDKTLAAARAIISDLLEEIEGDAELRAGRFVREKPARFEPTEPVTSRADRTLRAD